MSASFQLQYLINSDSNWQTLANYTEFYSVYCAMLAEIQHNTCGFSYRIVDADNIDIIVVEWLDNEQINFIPPFEYYGHTRENMPRFV